MKPVIGIVPLVDKQRDSFWMLPGYMEGITEAGGIPIMLPLTKDPETIGELLDRLQGILLTGGQDVQPEVYGDEAIKECGEVSPERDEMEKELLAQALDRDMPILGICRGIQFLNAYLGGTLYQDLPVQYPTGTKHHQSAPYDMPCHSVQLKKDGGLYGLLHTDTLQVNSYHHQAIKEKAKSLKTMAVSEDGLTEAVELPEKKFVWGVQWHPEFSFRSDVNSIKIFEEFIRHCG